MSWKSVAQTNTATGLSQMAILVLHEGCKCQFARWTPLHLIARALQWHVVPRLPLNYGQRLTHSCVSVTVYSLMSGYHCLLSWPVMAGANSVRLGSAQKN